MSRSDELVLETKHNWKRLHADSQVIVYGAKSLALDQAEWVSYSATHIAEKRFMFPTTYRSEWTFAVGRYPQRGGEKIDLFYTTYGRRSDPPEDWTFLASLARHYLEPRLLNDLIARIAEGETVSVGGSVQVALGGIACAKPRLSLRWADIRATRLENGVVRVYRQGVDKPVLSIPLGHPNAGLIPDLFTGFAPR